MQPTMKIRRANDRGITRAEWLDSRHTFSFGEYLDPKQMGFRALRVINEDIVLPGEGFPLHPHRDMEILTFVLRGTLAHQDSLGSSSEIKAGEAQRMTAGTGVLHSEFNPSQTEPVHLLQIWLLPGSKGLPPSYEQKRFDETPAGHPLLLASPEGDQGSLTLHQDARLWVYRLGALQSTEFETRPGRYLWLQILTGKVKLRDQVLSAGDGMAVEGFDRLSFSGGEDDTQVLVFDLA